MTIRREYVYAEGGTGRAGVACALYRGDYHVITTATMNTQKEADERADELLERMHVM